MSHPKIDCPFAAAMRSFLRADPDVIMAGEMRDHETAATGITYSPELMLYRPKGCPQCNNSGYKGRMGVHELLVGTDEMKKAIQRKASIDEMRRMAMQDGMRTLLQDALEKAFKGVTDVKQARAVAVKVGGRYAGIDS